MNIYVGNLASSVTDEQLKGLFEEYGTVDSANIIKDRASGESKGFGFIEMPESEEAKKAIEELNEKEVEGNCLKVSKAKGKKGGGGGRDRGRGRGFGGPRGNRGSSGNSSRGRGRSRARF